jgi:mono/diheme cytochrome c family protein
MRTNRIKLFAIICFAVLVVLLTVFKEVPARVTPFMTDDPAVTFKAKCAMCHTPTASKFYDPAKTDEEHVAAIMKGRKSEKPPFMPGYEAKGMTEEEAKALAAYMKTLRPAN